MMLPLEPRRAHHSSPQQSRSGFAFEGGGFFLRQYALANGCSVGVPFISPTLDSQVQVLRKSACQELVQPANRDAKASLRSSRNCRRSTLPLSAANCPAASAT